MIDKLTAKMWYVLVFLGGLGVLCHVFGWSKTFDLKQEVDELKNTIAKVEILNQELQYLKQNHRDFEVSEEKSKGHFQARILEDLELQLDAIGGELYGVEPAHTVDVNQYEVQTWIVAVEGNFSELLQLQQHYERSSSFRLLSVNYQKDEALFGRKPKLTASYYLQNIVKNG